MDIVFLGLAAALGALMAGLAWGAERLARRASEPRP